MKVIAFMESALPINFFLSDFIVSHHLFSLLREIVCSCVFLFEIHWQFF